MLIWNDISQEWPGKMRGHTEAVVIGKNEVMLRRQKIWDAALAPILLNTAVSLNFLYKQIWKSIPMWKTSAEYMISINHLNDPSALILNY